MAKELWGEAEGRAGIARNEGRRTAPPDVWDRVRDDHLAGMSAQQCCVRWRRNLVIPGPDALPAPGAVVTVLRCH